LKGKKKSASKTTEMHTNPTKVVSRRNNRRGPGAPVNRGPLAIMKEEEKEAPDKGKIIQDALSHQVRVGRYNICTEAHVRVTGHSI